MSTRRITKERHQAVTAQMVCPGCWDFKVITQHKFKGNEDVLGKRTYAGTYFCCGGEHGHLCWNMTKSASSPRLYETYGPKATRTPK